MEGPDAEEHERHLRDEWEAWVERPVRAAGLPVPRLIVRTSPYRSVLGPLLRLISEFDARGPNRPVAVVLPQLIEGRWWEALMHTHRERKLRIALLRDGGPNLAVIGVPYQLTPPAPARVLAAEEPARAA